MAVFGLDEIVINTGSYDPAPRHCSYELIAPEQAERLGIVVVTRESIDDAINRGLVPADADALYAEAEKYARSLKQQRAASHVAGVSGPR
jgi:hypothetical protein